jgi:23S rRNA pseudouridine2604 synthase
MVEAVGYDVKRLKRIRIESVNLGDLPDGKWRKMTREEQADILKRIGTES